MKSPRRSRNYRRQRGRLLAGLSAVALLASASVTFSPPEPAQASWQGQVTTWASGLNTALGKADKIFSPAVVEGLAPVGIALSIAGPLISTIFGTGQPTTSDIMAKLQKLDDIEAELKQVQDHLSTIDDEVLNVDTDVLLAECNIETSELQAYVTSLGTADATYQDVLDEIELIRTGAETDNGALNVTVDSFITAVLGSTTTYSVSGSSMESAVLEVHNRLVSTEGSVGVIQSCGKAYLAEWNQNAAAAAPTTNSTATGAWADDRQYYDKLQDVLRYWQTAEAHGMFLLQEATVMQASRAYTDQTQLVIPPADRGELCARASAISSAPRAKVLCRTGLKAATNFYTQIAEQWKVLGMPITNDAVIMTLGANVSRLPGAPAESAVWARNPQSVPADWTTSTWQGGGAPATYDSIAGFVPANSQRWKDLVSGFSASHLSDIAPKLDARQGWKSGDPYGSAQVQPFAPVDILSKMSGVRDAVTGDAAFTSVPNYVWIPGESGSHRFPNFYFRGPTAQNPPTQLSFPDARFLQGQPSGTAGLVSPISVAVRCFVANIDGVVCGEDKIASWWIANQVSQYPEYDSYGHTTGTYVVTPRSQSVPSLTIGSSVAPFPQCPGADLLCEARPIGLNAQGPTAGVIGDAPAWLADQPNQSTQALWPVAATPSCPSDPSEPGVSQVTVWGVPTRCDADIDTWLQGVVPDPSLAALAPQPMTSVQLRANGNKDPYVGATCVEPTWADSAVYPASDLLVTWDEYENSRFSAVTADGRWSTSTTDDWYNINFNEFAADAGWSDQPDFTVTCSFRARYVGLANATEVTSGPVSAKVDDKGNYQFGSPLLGGAAPMPPVSGPVTNPKSPAPAPALSAPAPTPTASALPSERSTRVDARKEAAASGLARTGPQWINLMAAIGIVTLVSGLALRLIGRRRAEQ